MDFAAYMVIICLVSVLTLLGISAALQFIENVIAKLIGIITAITIAIVIIALMIIFFGLLL